MLNFASTIVVFDKCLLSCIQTAWTADIPAAAASTTLGASLMRSDAHTCFPPSIPFELCRGVTRFERHCAENDIEVDYKVISMLYNNPYDMSVLGNNNKLKLMARAIIMETVDEHYSRWAGPCNILLLTQGC
jgi:hypothetical protein